MKKLSILISLALLIAFTSCQKEHTGQGPDLGYNYFPTNVGHQLIYDVRTIYKDAIDTVDSSYQILETVESVFNDNQGRPTQRLERYERKTANDPWVIDSVWTSTLTTTQALKDEDNITYIKLTFPIVVNKTWNGNAYNSLPGDEGQYVYTSANDPDAISGFNFDSTLTVTQWSYSDFIESHYHVEKYATGVGLYYKVRSNYYLTPDSTHPGGIDTTSSSYYRETLVSFIK